MSKISLLKIETVFLQQQPKKSCNVLYLIMLHEYGNVAKKFQLSILYRRREKKFLIVKALRLSDKVNYRVASQLIKNIFSKISKNFARYLIKNFGKISRPRQTDISSLFM